MTFSSMSSFKKYYINSVPGGKENVKKFVLKIGFGLYFLLMYACLIKIYVYIEKSSFKKYKN